MSGYAVRCDGAGCEARIPFGFHEGATAALERHGWWMRVEGDKAWHYCPTCPKPDGAEPVRTVAGELLKRVAARAED